MTSLLRRKRRTIPRAAPATLARKTIRSLIVLLAALLGSLPGMAPALRAQSFQNVRSPESPDSSVTPRFVPAPRAGRSVLVPAAGTTGNGTTGVAVHLDQVSPGPSFPILPVAAHQGIQPARPPVREEETDEPLIRPELPGMQRLFLRESETQFFERVRKQMKKQGNEFFVPEEIPVSKEGFTQQFYPRLDPATKQPFQRREEVVEPNFVCHRRLLFEQPNFERTAYSFGILQPAVGLAVFYYDMAMLPYHVWSDPCDRLDCSAGKCLPGDPAPLLLYRERFSLTGLAAEAGTVVGLLYLFPFPWMMP